jgi:hypothetical protein
MLGLDQFVDQCRGGSESDPSLLPAGRHHEPGEQMGFAGATVADQDDRFGLGDVVALGQFMDLLRRDSGVAREVEFLKGFHPRQTSFADAPLDQSLFAILEFRLQQRFEIAEVGAPFTHRLLGELRALRGYTRQPQDLALLADGGGFQRGALRIHDAASWPSSPS